jgi:quercetin dioxygenase-like cupin family protein
VKSLLAFGPFVLPLLLALQEPVPVDREPLHRVVFANEYVEVMHLILPPGQSTLFHTHSHDGVAVRLSEATANVDIPGRDSTPPGVSHVGDVSAQAYAEKPMTHRVNNVGKTPFEVVDIEFLGRPPGPPTEPIATPAAENSSARVYRWVLPPGASTPEHTHERPYLIIAATAMQLAMKAPDGDSAAHSVKAADFHWVDAKVTHTLTNGGGESGVLFEVELK